MTRLLFLLVLNLCSIMVFAQQEDLLRDLEMSRKAERDRQLEQIYSLTTTGNYNKADDLYKEVLASGMAIPSTFCYFFGKNSFHLDQYTQSIDWLSKYIELKGTTGEHYNDAKELIDKNKHKLQQKRENTSGEVQVLSQDFTIDCGPSGKVVCPVCEGQTVVITKTAFGSSYKTCTYCDKDGNMDCAEYNKLLKGEQSSGR